MKHFSTLFISLFFSFFFINASYASSQETVKIKKDTTANFYLHNNQEVKYITLKKGETYLATSEDLNWMIEIGNAKVHIDKQDAKSTNEKITPAQNNNKIQILTNESTPVYNSHRNSSKQIATLSANTRISSNGVKGYFYEVVIGGKLGYVPIKKMQIDAGVPTLIYHHFVENIDKSYFRNNISVVDIGDFEQQMTFLKNEGYTTISLKDLDLWMQKKQALPAKAVALTFDDANLSLEKMVYPILKERNMHGTTFVIGNRVKEETPPFNSEAEIVQFAGFNELHSIMDLIEIEHHTYALHVYNDTLQRSQLQLTSARDLHYDIQQMNEVLKQIDPNIQAQYYSYPYGKFNKNHEATFIENNISLAFLNKGGKTKITSPRLYVPRIPVQNSMPLEQFKSLVQN
ncbi:polysaccharide deacetylase family protein [Solibacillus ferritrahens]|uniref:polysaccharide deacetylase family protein n=1 Tax=Solibacillus ferritrahens TaxID=3098620 RepID=UPI00300B2678